MQLAEPNPHVRRFGSMEAGAQSRTDDGELAREAEPVRRWLIGFFRRRIREEEDVEDLVQDVFARIVSRNSETPVGNLGAYVLRTATSVLADRWRRRSTRRSDLHVLIDLDREGEDPLHPERLLCGREELHAATAALLSLPERTRTIFILRRLEGYSLGEIARHQGISVSAVEKHVAKAVDHLVAAREKRDAA